MTFSKVKALFAGLVLALGMTFVPISASAASAVFSAESAASNYTVGNTFTVTIYENSSGDADSARADLTYEAGLLEFQGITGSGVFSTCLSQPSGGNGSITTGDCTILGAKKTGKQALATVTFKAIAAGTAHLNFSGSSRIVNAGVDFTWTAVNGVYTLANPVTPTPGQGGGSQNPAPAPNNTPKTNTSTNTTQQIATTATPDATAQAPAETTPEVTSATDTKKETPAKKTDKKESSKAPIFGLIAAILAVVVAVFAFRKLQAERAAKAEAVAAAASAAAVARAKEKKAAKASTAKKTSKK